MRIVYLYLPCVLALAAAATAGAAEAEAGFEVLRTPSGVRFGLVGDKGPSPAPTLFVFEDHPATQSLALANHADKLAGRPVWVCIGNHDQRVGTDRAIAFTRQVARASIARDQPAPVELHVMPAPGHRIHSTAHDEAAAWIAACLAEDQSP